MNTEKVFITYNENGNEILIYKKDKNNYIDLLNVGKNYTNIDTTLLIPFSTIKDKKHVLKFMLKKYYNASREELLDLNNIYIGKLSRISGVKNEIQTEILDSHYLIGGNREYFMRPAIKYEFEKQVINDNILLYKLDKYFVDVINVEVYPGKSSLNVYDKYKMMNVLFIPDSNEELIPFNNVIDNKNNGYMTRKLILEKYNKVKKDL